MSKNDTDLSLMPLGGLGEFGMNCLLMGAGQTRLMIDCGVMFPSDDEHGIDFVTPDFSHLERFPIDALVLTHGHEDHIGATPYLLQWLRRHRNGRRRQPLPIYGTRFTLALVRRRLDEHNALDEVDLRLIRPGQEVAIGDFGLEAIAVNHSIPDAVALALKTPVGTVVHTGDWRLDPRPVSSGQTDLARFCALGERGVRLLLSDSTNIEVGGLAVSEAEVAEALLDAFDLAPARVVVTLFSSNIGRIQSLLDAAHATGRQVAMLGRSLQQNSALAREMGFLRMPHPDLIIAPERINQTSPAELVVLAGGSQGEHGSSLYRVAMGEHSQMRVMHGDTLIYSSRQIPGNERRVTRVVDAFHRQGAEVLFPGTRALHTTGHAHREEQSLLLGMVKPKLFMPLHGDYRRLHMHAELAKRLGVPRSVIVNDGETLTVREHEHVISERLVTNPGYVLGRLGLAADTELLRQRRHLAFNGMVVVNVVLDADGGLVQAPWVETIGVAMDVDGVISQATRVVETALAQVDGPRSRDRIEESVRVELRRYFRRHLDRKPQISVVVNTLA